MFRHPLVREISWLLAAKAVALVVLYSLSFSPAHRQEVTPEKVEKALFVPAVSPMDEGERSHD